MYKTRPNSNIPTKGEKKRASFRVRQAISKLRPNPSSGSYRSAWRKRYANYQEYLSSQEWKNIKDIYYSEECNSVCESCGATKELQVHHHSYSAVGSPTEAMHLRTLCRTCHIEVHKKQSETGMSLKKATSAVIFANSNINAPKQPKPKARRKKKKRSKYAMTDKEKRFLSRFRK